MTEENRRAAVAQEMVRAERVLQSAELAAASGLWEPAVSQACYYAFHCARALLLSEGLEAKSHDGVFHLLALHFVQTGRLDPRLARSLRHLERERLSPDYDSAAVITDEMATEELAASRSFGDEARRLLREAGYLQAPL